MIITEIKLQKNGRFAVYADGNYILSADTQTLVQCNLRKGMELSEQELETVTREVQEQYAKNKALTLLTYRDHSKEELRRKLLRSVDEDAADAATSRMEELGLVDDDAFAEKFAREMLFRKLFGADRVLYEMERRGLDRENSREIIEQLDENPAERVIRFLKKKFPRGIEIEKERQRAISALHRNGFRWDEIREGIGQFEEEYGEE